MKRLFTVVAIISGVMIAASITYFTFSRPVPGQVNAPHIMAAAQAYAHDLQVRGLAVPATVDLRDLVAKGLVNSADVSGFDGMQVTVSLAASIGNFQDVVMRVRLQDGSQLVALADGSIQAVSR